MNETLPESTARWPLLMHDQARLEYVRLLWKRASARQRLLRHWTDPRHPYAGRFSEQYRPLVERVLTTDPALDAELRTHGAEPAHHRAGNPTGLRIVLLIRKR